MVVAHSGEETSGLTHYIQRVVYLPWPTFGMSICNTPAFPLRGKIISLLQIIWRLADGI